MKYSNFTGLSFLGLKGLAICQSFFLTSAPNKIKAILQAGLAFLGRLLDDLIAACQLVALHP
jgi:hypothetical protein